jgi:transposase InsO family protein
MKNELLKDIAFHNIEEVKAAVSVAVDFYNNERPHMSIDMMTPAVPEKSPRDGQVTGLSL